MNLSRKLLVLILILREREREDLTKFLRCKIDIQDILLAEDIFFPLKERP